MPAISSTGFRRILSALCFAVFTCLLLPQTAPEPGQVVGEVLKTVDALNARLLEMTALTDEEENQIGEAVTQKILQDNRETADERFDSGTIFNRLVKEVERRKIDYQLFVIRGDDFNAFSVPGGRVFILTGMLDGLERRDEVAFVLAHEIAHNELKHPIQKVQYQARASKISPALGNVVQTAYEVYRTPFEKDEERAADLRAVKLMEAAGFNRQGAIRFFEKLELQEQNFQKTKRGPLSDFLADHPTAKDRKQTIEKSR